MSSQQLMIVDCDCGVDDALAIFLALAHRKTWKLVAITCCHGNTTLENVCDNVRKVLQLCGETEIPVYRGCDRALVKSVDIKLVHGNDGLGNVANQYPHDQIKIAEGHAVNTLTNLAKKYRQEGINLVVLGPMTNVAMAHRMDPEFTENLKSIHFMGGNIHGVGNATSSAEFNFACDPEAANIVLTESKCPVTMVPWETTVNHYMSWEFLEELANMGKPLSNFVKKVEAVLEHKCEPNKTTYVDCDFMAMASLVCPNCIKTIEKHCLSVETAGRLTTGQTVVERIPPAQSQRNLINIVTEFYDLSLNELRIKMVCQ